MSTPPAAQVPPAAAVAIALNPLRLADPFRWLRKGLQDVVAAPGIALFYGACFWCMALVLGWVFRMAKCIPIAPHHEDPEAYQRAFDTAQQVLAEGNTYTRGRFRRGSNVPSA